MKTKSLCQSVRLVCWICTASASPFSPALQASKIHELLDDRTSPFVALSEAEVYSLGAGFDFPDGGQTVKKLADAAPGGAFDFRALEGIPAQTLGYEVQWCVERFKRYNLEWDIAAVKLSSADPGAKALPWVVIINGGAANKYEFFVDPLNQAAAFQYLALKANVMIVSIPGNFKYGGWLEPIESEDRQPAYLLDKTLTKAEYEVRNAIMTNEVVLQGLKALILNHLKGARFLIVGHSTSGELAFLAHADPELRAISQGMFLGWGSGGPARYRAIRGVKEPHKATRWVEPEKRTPLHELSRRDAAGYGRTYSRWLNPVYLPGMSTEDIGAAWLKAEERRRPNFKQQIQSLEHGDRIGYLGWMEVQINQLLAASGNPWGIDYEDIHQDLFSSLYAPMDGFQKMVWIVNKFDRNHWVPEMPMDSPEVFIANEFRLKNPQAAISVLLLDAPMTHYGHIEKGREVAAAIYEVLTHFPAQW